jgi:imidazolonepropionase-like amidohydrolase
VLRGATLVPARFMGLDQRLGSVALGRTASLLVLRSNPLDDVGHASQIEAVFLRGRHFDRAALDGLLEAARGLAAPADRRA